MIVTEQYKPSVFVYNTLQTAKWINKQQVHYKMAANRTTARCFIKTNKVFIKTFIASVAIKTADSSFYAILWKTILHFPFTHSAF